MEDLQGLDVEGELDGVTTCPSVDFRPWMDLAVGFDAGDGK